MSGKTNFQPRLVGFLCETGAQVFYNVSNPVCRKLPVNFIGLSVARISQVQTNDILKAFLAGADGVLIAGCEICHQQQMQAHFSAITQALESLGIESDRLDLQWISANEEEKFLRVVHAMMEQLREMPPLRLPAGLGKNIAYCG
jgi:coenzyme F420-reducing hydrogenase delta subunit